MAGVASFTHNVGACMIGEGIQKTVRAMTVTAFRAGVRVAAALEDGGCHAGGHSAVVASCAGSVDTRVIKATVWFYIHEMGGVVALVAFHHRRRMEFRFADGQDTVVAFAAISEKYFLVIDKWGRGEAQRCMTGLAHITGCDMIWLLR